MKVLLLICLALAALPCGLFLVNLLLYRRLPAAPADVPPAPVSILIPARNEEHSISAALDAALAQTGVEIEVVVLDDHSEDRTAEIVRSYAERDPRVRLETPPPLPDGWNGKQHACWILSQRAAHEVLLFTDADLRLAPGAAARMARFLETSGAALISGVPRQVTGSLAETMVIPLIHFLLLAYLPLIGMRLRRTDPAFSAGIGQLFMAQKAAYRRAGGHEAIKASRHDGVQLPRAFRRAGFTTDLFDATDIAQVRMYEDAHQVIEGFAKNADEGLGSTAAILPWTLILLLGQALPVLLLFHLWIVEDMGAWTEWQLNLARIPPKERVLTDVGLAFVAAACAYLPRFIAAFRFRQSWIGALLHPAGVTLLVGIQWYALVNRLRGRTTTWKGRAS